MPCSFVFGGDSALDLFAVGVGMAGSILLEPAGRATSISYLPVVFALVWGMLLFQEFPDALSIAGALLMLASTVGVARWRSRRAGEIA